MRCVCPVSPDAECFQSVFPMPQPHKEPNSGVRTAAYLTPFDRVAVSGIWENEDQKLARVRFGFRALTHTPVAFQEASLTFRDLSLPAVFSLLTLYVRLPVAHWRS